MPVELPPDRLQSVWNDAQARRDAQAKRQRYYDGDHDKRKGGDTYSDGSKKSNRFANWIKFIVNRYVGALTSTPYQITDTDDADPAQVIEGEAAPLTGPQMYTELTDDNNLDARDVENLRNALLKGFSVEVHEFHARESDGDESGSVQGQIVVYNDDPENWTFIEDEYGDVAGALRSITLEANTVFQDEVLEDKRELMTFYDDRFIYDYERVGTDSAWQPIGDPREHFYGRVPVIRWRVNKRCKPIISDALIGQQDEYNDVDSSSGDAIRSFQDCVLKTWGIDSDYIKKNAKNISESKHLPLDDKQTDDAVYMTRELDYEPVESRLSRTREHIHMDGEVPDVAQIVGATGVTSGIALRLKFLPMEQAAAGMIHYLKEGLRERITLINAMLRRSQGAEIEGVIPTVQFTLPMNVVEERKSLAEMNEAQVLSLKTILELMPGIDDPERELKRLKGQGMTDPLAESTPETQAALEIQAQEAEAAIVPTIQELINDISTGVRDELIRTGTFQRELIRMRATESSQPVETGA